MPDLASFEKLRHREMVTVLREERLEVTGNKQVLTLRWKKHIQNRTKESEQTQHDPVGKIERLLEGVLLSEFQKVSQTTATCLKTLEYPEIFQLKDEEDDLSSILAPMEQYVNVFDAVKDSFGATTNPARNFQILLNKLRENLGAVDAHPVVAPFFRLRGISVTIIPKDDTSHHEEGLQHETKIIQEGLQFALGRWQNSFPTDDKEILRWPGDFGDQERKALRNFVGGYLDDHEAALAWPMDKDTQDSMVKNMLSSEKFPTYPEKARTKSVAQAVFEEVRKNRIRLNQRHQSGLKRPKKSLPGSVSPEKKGHVAVNSDEDLFEESLVYTAAPRRKRPLVLDSEDENEMDVRADNARRGRKTTFGQEPVMLGDQGVVDKAPGASRSQRGAVHYTRASHPEEGETKQGVIGNTADRPIVLSDEIDQKEYTTAPNQRKMNNQKRPAPSMPFVSIGAKRVFAHEIPDTDDEDD